MDRFRLWCNDHVTGTPPRRAPHYGDNESYGWPMRDCARNLVHWLADRCNPPLEFRGDANGRIWHFIGDDPDRAQLVFTSDKGDGVIELSIDDSNWVRAEIFVSDSLVLRVWLEDPYEEKEFWPDDSEAVVSATDDPPGRISKRAAWLQLKCADFPGVPDQANGYWTVEDARD